MEMCCDNDDVRRSREPSWVHERRISTTVLMVDFFFDFFFDDFDAFTNLATALAVSANLGCSTTGAASAAACDDSGCWVEGADAAVPAPASSPAPFVTLVSRSKCRRSRSSIDSAGITHGASSMWCKVEPGALQVTAMANEIHLDRFVVVRLQVDRKSH